MRNRLRAWREQFLEGILPLLQWELRSYLRGARGSFILLLSTGTVILLAGICIPITFGVYDLSAHAEGAADIGHQFYGAFLCLEGLLVLLLMPLLTINTISGEVRRGTLEALVLTRLRPIDIVLGKVLAAFSFFALLLLALLPVLAIVFTVGGVSLPELLLGYLLLLASAFCAGATGCLASAASRSFPETIILTLAYLYGCFGFSTLIVIIGLPLLFLPAVVTQWKERRRPIIRIGILFALICVGWWGLLYLIAQSIHINEYNADLFCFPANCFSALIQHDLGFSWWPLAVGMNCGVLAFCGGFMLYLAADFVRQQCLGDRRCRRR